MIDISQTEHLQQATESIKLLDYIHNLFVCNKINEHRYTDCFLGCFSLNIWN